jgi:methylated-DNA-protein-cysteine methyltransferase-like protein
MSSNYDKIYSVIERIPEGSVATYGQIARMAGLAGHARQVGYALYSLPEELELPWHRVVNARGEISRRSDPVWETVQRQLLEKEKIVFNANGRISLDKYRWNP